MGRKKERKIGEGCFANGFSPPLLLSPCYNSSLQTSRVPNEWSLFFLSSPSSFYSWAGNSVFHMHRSLWQNVFQFPQVLRTQMTHLGSFVGGNFGAHRCLACWWSAQRISHRWHGRIRNGWYLARSRRRFLKRGIARRRTGWVRRRVRRADSKICAFRASNPPLSTKIVL